MNKIAKANYKIFKDYKDIKSLRKIVEKWLKATFTGKKIKNRQTKFIIEFNSKSFKKLVSGKVGKIKLYSLSALKDIIQNGILTKVDIDKKERTEIIAYYYFKS